MRRLLLLPLFLFGLSCSIHASHRYPDRGSYRVRNMAYELERATWSLRQDAEHAFHYRSRYENKALRELSRLAKRARNFRRSVERHYWDDRRARKDYAKLLRQYDRTEEALSRLYTRGRIYRSLDRVRYLIDRLGYYYTGYGDYRHKRYRYR